MQYFVYVLTHPLTGEVAYVGITNNLYERFKAHISDQTKDHPKVLWIKHLKQVGLIPSVKVIECLHTVKDARKRERYWIHHYLSQGICLTNLVHIPRFRIATSKDAKVVEHGNKNDLLSTSMIKQEYGISKMTVSRRMKEGVLTPTNASPVLYRQHKLFFRRSDVERLLAATA